MAPFPGQGAWAVKTAATCRSPTVDGPREQGRGLDPSSPAKAIVGHGACASKAGSENLAISPHPELSLGVCHSDPKPNGSL